MINKKSIDSIAKLSSVSYDSDTEEVFVTFKVVSEEYKNLVFRLSKRDDIEWIIRGDSLGFSHKDLD